MKKVTTHCDVCNRQMDWSDSPGAYSINGFTHHDGSFLVSYTETSRTVCGSSGTPVQHLSIPSHICSVACMKKHFNRWLDSLPEPDWTRMEKD